ncbi:MAG: DNA polymerase I [Ruminococcaceae bacterium]|nr:DNA polymerase I [Oscillospiraceae bacterium]
MKLLAIDGNSIINRAFYGIKLLTTKDGRYTNGVYGFINILNKLLESEAPDGVAVAFDLKAPTFRHKKYDAYKAGRHKTPDELLSQFPILKEWLRLAGYHCIECEGYEADDILGTLAKSAENSGHECVIATGDRDSLQLVSEHTRVLLTATKMGRPEITNYTPDTLFERYSLTPCEMIELKALMGDSSDNIPGVAGVGEKTATDLISRYHSVDYIYEHLDELDIKDGVRNKLRDGKENAYLSLFLGTICKNAPIDTDITNYITAERNEAELARLMTGLEFFKLMEKMGISPDSTPPTATKTQTAIAINVTADNSKVGSCAVLYADENGYAAVSDNKVFRCDKAFFEKILNDEKIEKKVYDYKNLSKEYPKCKNIVFDAMLAGYLCNPAASSYAIDRLAAEYSAPSPKITGDADEVLQNAVLLDSVCKVLESALNESGQATLLYDIELPLARVLGEMEKIGFLADSNGLKAMGEELAERISIIEQEIYGDVGYEFNLNSPKQLGKALFEDLKITPAKKTKNGYSTGAEILEKLQYEYPVVGKILEYRKLAKLKSTYCEGLLNAISDDGRIHSTFNQTEARTGRISSLEPNLQNIPVRTQEGKRLREYFTAAEGYVLCDADYSQIELRVLASIANDTAMINAFNSDTDIHTLTASQVFGMPVEMITPTLRYRAKAVNFGIIYGIGAFSLSKDIDVTRKEAEAYIKGYLATYPGVERYMNEVIEQAKNNGYVSTLFGRRRYLPELSASNHMLRAFGERVARNAPIQGTAADIIKIAMIRVYERLKKELPDARLILQVHDELIVECPCEKADEACHILEDEMENAVSMAVKLKVEAHCGKNWLEAKG